MFNQVQQAFNQADIFTLRRLYKALKEGQPFTDFAETPMEEDQLSQQVARLRLEVDRYIVSIQELRQTDTFKILSEHLDWDSYFAEAKLQLENECEKMRNELNQDLP